MSESCSVASDSLRPHGLFSLWNSPCQNTGVDSSIFLIPADLPDPEIKPGSPALQADSLPTELSGRPVELKSRSENVGLGMEVKSSYPSSTCGKTIK